MRRAGEIIAEILIDKFGPDFMENAQSNTGLFSYWAELVAEVWPHENPPSVAAHSRIKELERGVLLVEADHPGCVQILQTKQVEILSAVQKKYPNLEIRSITFKLSRR